MISFCELPLLISVIVAGKRKTLQLFSLNFNCRKLVLLSGNFCFKNAKVWGGGILKQKVEQS